MPMGHNLISKNQLNIYTNDWQLECYVSMAEMLRPKKKAKHQDLSTTTLGYLHSRPGTTKVKYCKRMKILFDTGCGATLIHQSLVKNSSRNMINLAIGVQKLEVFKLPKLVRLISHSLLSMRKETLAGELLFMNLTNYLANMI